MCSSYCRACSFQCYFISIILILISFWIKQIHYQNHCSTGRVSFGPLTLFWETDDVLWSYNLTQLTFLYSLSQWVLYDILVSFYTWQSLTSGYLPIGTVRMMQRLHLVFKFQGNEQPFWVIIEVGYTAHLLNEK